MALASERYSATALLASKRAESGFILPFALVVIASLALVAAAAFSAVSNSAETIRALDESAAEDIALATAEAQATYAFLTAAPVSEGIWLGSAATADGSSLDGFAGTEAASPLSNNPALNASPMYWQGNGAARGVETSSGRVIVEYRDAAGLFPFSSADETKAGRFLEMFGFSRDAAVEMAARVADYEDPDNVRRFRGAERTDYRLFSRKPPSNSPLRTPEELGRVLGFFEAAPPNFWSDVVAYATAEQGTMLEYAAPPRLSPLAATTSASEGDLDAISAQARLPSPRARFLLKVTGERRTRTRAVDIRRSPSVSQSPFQRYIAYETTEFTKSTANGDVDIAPILFADPDRAPQ